HPNGGLMQASDGLLYGMTANGGDSALGTIFCYDITTGHYQKLVNLTNASGSYPGFGHLVEYIAPGSTTLYRHPSPVS
ncbi:choice-of-anchor tandem repeat GloVer-containing protein, partial [Vibrio parahaemolyticus]